MTNRTLTALLLTLALVASGCGVLGGNGAYTVTAEMARSYNLFPGSPVRVVGIDVGTIADVRVPEGGETVEVTLRIDGDVPLPADATAVVVPEALIGERYVQLSAYEDGDRLEDGDEIPLERTEVPAEFDEVLESLNQFVGGLDEDEIARFVDNFAETFDGQGEQLGRTIDQAHEAIGVLKNNDEELIALASRLADLNATLATRDQQLGQIIQDFDTLAGSLVDDREDIDAALTGLVRMTRELAELFETNRETLEQDIGTLTRVGRSAQRNLDYVSVGILHSAELFRHAERVVERDRNMIPLQNQTDELVPQLTEAIIFRLQGMCLQAGLDEGECTFELIEGLLGGDVCLPPFVPCGENGDATPLEDALVALVAQDPELGDALLEQMAEQQEQQRRQRQAEEEDDEEDEGPTSEIEPDLDEDDDGGLVDGLLGMGGPR
jgi:phospholipid/cholesterol/gamma-HCH transport system substrate-binding protein